MIVEGDSVVVLLPDGRMQGITDPGGFPADPIFLEGITSDDIAGFEVSHTCLELFTELEVPFGVLVIIA